MLSGYLGVDYRFVPNALAGLAASYSSLDLTSTSEAEGKATLTGSLVNVYPYGLWMPEEWLGIWGITGRGRMLLVHEDPHIREWGASATLTWAPPDHGPGPSVSVAPSWGRPASGMDALWRDPQALLATHGGAADRAARSSWLPDTVDVTVGYRLDGLELQAVGRHLTGSGDTGYRFGFGGTLELPIRTS